MSTSSSKHKKRILIVEDERPLSQALQMKFESLGYAIVVAHDGQQALDAVQQSASPFDLVLLDLVMPHVDGFEVLRVLKQEQQNPVPVIVSTNLSAPSDEQRARQLGAADYFVKSDTPMSAVVQYVERALGGVKS